MKKYLLFLLLIFFSSQVYSQEKFGSISGIVTDSGKIPLDGVILKLVGTYLGGLSDSEGKFKIEDISPGNYTLRVEVEGFKTVEETDIQERSVENKEYNIIMKAA